MNIPHRSMRYKPRNRAFLTLALLAILPVAAGAATGPTEKATLNLDKILSGKRACGTATSMQFIAEDELLILASSGANCFNNLNELELIVVTTSGRIIARKPWPSTYPVVILSGKRIVTADLRNIIVMDENFQPVESIPLPPVIANSSAILRKIGPDNLLVQGPRGDMFEYGGMPLHSVERKPSEENNPIPTIYLSEGGRKVTLKERTLLVTSADGTTQKLSDLSWVIPCTGHCQMYGAGQTYKVVTQVKKRALFISSGSHLPITDAAGLFPYFRVSVFDLDSGAEIVRKQYVTKTSIRTADISPDGEYVAFNNGDHILVEKLK